MSNARDNRDRAHQASRASSRTAARGRPFRIVCFSAGAERVPGEGRGHHEGTPGDPSAIAAEMDEITSKRETTQPVKSRTGGSTFKNPPGHKAWQLIDAAGCRGLIVGGAQVSQLHCNFLINLGNATAADIEGLGEEVRRRVKDTSGVTLEWEIKRIGV